MSFATPWLWLGALGVVVPVWLHLVRRHRTGARHFSTLLFLEDEPRPRRVPLRLRDPLLFAMRVLGLLAVVAAFTGPFLRRPSGATIVESRVHVLDNTLSRQVDDGAAKGSSQIRRALRLAGPGIQDAVVVLGAQPRVLAGFGDSREQAIAALSAVAPTYERGSYLEAFRLANRLLAQSLGEKKRIVFYGDGQANQWSENETAAPFLEGTEVELVGTPTVAELPNLFVSEPAAQRLFSGDDAFVEVTLRLGHQGPAASAVMTLRVDGREMLHRNVSLQGEPPLLNLQAEWKDDPGHWVSGEVSIQGMPDALAADNHAYFALPPVTEGRVALLAHSPYLRTALSPEVARGRWNVRELDPAQPAAQMLADDLLDVLVVESDFLQSEGVRNLVLRYLDNGRGVLLPVGRITPLVSGVLRQLGFEPETPVGPTAETELRYLAAEHPLFHPFFAPDLGGLGDVRVLSPVRLRATAGVPLAFGADGRGLVFEGTRSAGRLLITTFSLDRTQTNWPVLPTFVPFLDVAIQDLRQGTAPETSVEPGTVQVMALPPGAKATLLVVRDGDRVVLRAPFEGGRARLAAPAAPGLYTITWDDTPAVRQMMAVNPSVRESHLHFVTEPPALAAWRIADAGAARRPREAGDTAPRRAAKEQRRWWWCLAAGLFLLAAETALTARRRSRLATAIAARAA